MARGLFACMSIRWFCSEIKIFSQNSNMNLIGKKLGKLPPNLICLQQIYFKQKAYSLFKTDMVIAKNTKLY